MNGSKSIVTHTKTVPDVLSLIGWVEPKGKYSDLKVVCSNVPCKCTPIGLLECSTPERIEVDIAHLRPGTSTMEFARDPNLLLHDRVQPIWEIKSTLQNCSY